MTRVEMVRMLARLEDAIQRRNKLERMMYNAQPVPGGSAETQYQEAVATVEDIEEAILNLVS